MMHEKTFDAINKLKEVEFELHRLKNALEMANRALDSMTTKREWVGLTDDEIDSIFVDYGWCISTLYLRVVRSIEAKLKEKNGG